MTAPAAARLRAGSALAYRAYVQKLAAWIAAGRRADLDGWQAALGSWLRMGILAGLGYAAFQAFAGTPWAMWTVAAWWLVRAWRAGAQHPVQHAPAEDEAGPPEEPLPAVDIAAAARTVADGGHGAHYEALAEHLTKTTRRPWDAAAVRAACRAAGIPHCGSVRQRGRGVSTGVRAADLPTPSPAPSPATAAAVVAAGQAAPTEAATATATGPELHVEGALRIVREPSSTRHYTVGRG